ncbi:MAG: hypothetical protein AAF431_00755 [Pseudomonadota bacterium]
MKNYDDQHYRADELDELLEQRGEVQADPDLAKRIIDATSALPQDARQSSSATFDFSRLQPSSGNSLGSRLVQILTSLLSPKPIAAATVAVSLAVVLSSGFWSVEQPLPQITDNPPTSTQLVDVELVTEEFSWEELLLLQDELAFAQL